jgi:release factor glutamine methyltransferase
LTVSEFLSKSIRTLRQNGIENPELEAQILLSTALDIDKNRLLLVMNTELSESQLSKAEGFVELRTTRLPLQYITRNVEFLGLRFSVVPGVFIPRPETELLAMEAIKITAGLPSPLILEPGTGSGVISVILAVKCKQALVYANDISRDAIDVARENARAHGVYERVFFHVGRLFDAVTTEPTWGGAQVLICNPPYVPSAEISLLEPEIRQHEPLAAIDGGEDGLRCIRAILTQGPSLLVNGGWLMLEIGIHQAETVKEMAVSAGLDDVDTVRDLSGTERVLVGRKP